MTINSARAEGSDCRRAKGSVFCNVVNTKCVNCQSYFAKAACYGFHSGTKTCEQSTGGGKNFSLCHQLESNNGGPVGPSHSAGFPHSFQGGAPPNAPSSSVPVFRGTDEVNARGNFFLAGERSGGDSGSRCLGRGILLDPLLGAQDGRSDETSHKSKSTQFLGSPTAFQDGGYPHTTGDSSTGRVACQARLEGRLLHSPNPSGTPEVPPLCGRPSPVPIHVSSVRSLLCTLGFYQGSKASRCLPEKFRSSPYRLYRRYPNNREVPGRSSESRGGLDRSIRGSGLHCQYGEVCVDPVPADRVPGAAVGYFHYVPESPRSQDQDDSGRRCSASSTEQHQCTQGSTVYREAECCFPGSVSSPAVLSPPAEGPTRGPVQRRSELRLFSPVVSGISGGSSVVAGAFEPVEWSNPAETSSAVADSVRRLHDRVGSCLQGYPDGWSVVSRGAEDAHQLFGTVSSNIGCASLCQRSVGDIDPPAAGQSVSCGLHQPSGGYGVPAASTAGKNPVALGSSAGHCPVSSTHSGSDQSSGRCGVQDDNRSPGLETRSGSFSENQCHLGSPGSGSVCLSPFLSAGPVLQLETGSTSRSNRCFSTRLGATEGLCQPSLVSSRESSEAGEGPTGSGHIGGSSLERSTVVPGSSGDALGFSSVDSSVSRSVSHDLRVSSHEFSAPTSRMAYLRGKFASQNLSSKAGDLLLASWRTKSNKTYDSHFKKWLCWCSARGADPISGPVSEVANFLANLHEEGYQSSSLNVFRSAISSVHDKVDGMEVGKHPTIARLLKGAFHERPPLPRYTSTWDVNTVLQYLRTLGPTAGLTLKQLTYKLAMLLALTRPSRSADLALLVWREGALVLRE